MGPEASGKTWLAGRVAQALSSSVLVDPRTEILSRSGYQTMFEWSTAGGDLPSLIGRQVERELEASNVVIDNGVMDLFCFMQRWQWNRLSPDAVEGARDLTTQAVRRYDRILVTPPRIVAGFASHRFRDATNAVQTARLIDALAGELDLKLHRLPVADQESVLAAALAVLK